MASFTGLTQMSQRYLEVEMISSSVHLDHLASLWVSASRIYGPCKDPNSRQLNYMGSSFDMLVHAVNVLEPLRISLRNIHRMGKDTNMCGSKWVRHGSKCKCNK